ncbi:MAG: hydrogenase expression/formation protein [Pseudomonadota bacterium]
MNNDDLIPVLNVGSDIAARSNPMVWEGEEAAQGVFLSPDPTEDALALLGTPPMQLRPEPRLPEDFVPSARLRGWLEELEQNLAAVAKSPHDIRSLPVTGLDELSRQAITEILGRGEVEGSVSLDGVIYTVVESVLAGVWRVKGSDGRDYVEVAHAPSVILQAANNLEIADFSIPAPSGDIMNAPAVLAEIHERARAWNGEENHVLNFTLLPMSEQDHDVLTGILGRAELEMTSGGFGDCQIMATRYRHVWAVQYVNAMGHTILDTIEIGELPAAACASWQDFEDSTERLAELLEAYLQ